MAMLDIESLRRKKQEKLRLLFVFKRLFYTEFKNPIDMKKVKVNTARLRNEVRTEINSARIINTPKEAMPMWERKLLSSMKQSSVHKGVRIR